MKDHPVRKVIVLVVELGLFLGACWVLYQQFFNAPIKSRLVVFSAGVFMAGSAGMLWTDFIKPLFVEDADDEEHS